MTPAEYVDSVGERMAADGCAVTWEQVGPVQALVGYKREFVPWLLTRVHTVTVVAAFRADGPSVHHFSRDVALSAQHVSGATVGLSALFSFAVIVTDGVDPAAAAAARKHPRTSLVRVQNVLVDTRANAVHTHKGFVLLGAIYNRRMRGNLAKYVVAPVRAERCDCQPVFNERDLAAPPSGFENAAALAQPR